MASDDISARTADRLARYDLFSKETIAHVAALAQVQASYPTYQDFFHSVGMNEVKFHTDKKGRGVSYVDIPAREIEKGVIVYHLPMANPLDPNQLYQVATVASALPAYRIIAFGNPAGKPYNFKEQNLRFKDRLAITFTTKRRVLVAAELDYLASKNITSMYQVGYSYGALKALLESNYAPAGSLKGIYTLEPVAHPRYPQQLAADFGRTMKPLGDYVNRTELKTFLDARKDSANMVDYTKGLTRQINVAIGYMLSRVDFLSLLNQVLARHPDAKAWVAWASKSELGNDAHLSTRLDALHQENPNIQGYRLEGDAHAVANDVHLTAALLYEALRS